MLIDVLKQSGVIEKIKDIKSANRFNNCQNNFSFQALLAIASIIAGSTTVYMTHKLGFGAFMAVLIAIVTLIVYMFVSSLSYDSIVEAKDIILIQNTQLEDMISQSSFEFFKGLAVNDRVAKLFYFEKQKKFAYIYVQRLSKKVNIYVAHEPDLIIADIWALLYTFSNNDGFQVLNDETIVNRYIHDGIAEITQMTAFKEKQLSVKNEVIAQQDLNLLNNESFEKELLKSIRMDILSSTDKESLYALINQYKAMPESKGKDTLLLELKAIVKLIQDNQQKVTSDVNQNIQYFKAKYSMLNQ